MKLSFVCADQLMSSFLPSRLSVTSNNIGKEGLMSLNEAMKVNTCLTHIYIWGNKLEEPVCLVRFHKSLNDQVQCSTTVRKVIQMPWCSLCMYNQAFSRLISSGRLLEEHTDVSPYEVDDHVFLAEASHGLHRHYYWTSRYGEYGDSSNSALTLMTSDSLALQIYPDSHSWFWQKCMLMLQNKTRFCDFLLLLNFFSCWQVK